MPKITKRIIDALEPDEASEQFLWDSELKGFGVRMMPSGVASYIIKYRNAEGRQRKMSIGRVGAMTPEVARLQARGKLTEVMQGGDPSAERHHLRQAVTLSEVCDLYLEEAAGRLKTNSYLTSKSQIEVHIKPLLGRHSVASLTYADVVKMQSDIAAGKKPAARKGRGGQSTGGKAVAGRSVVILGGILEYARKRGVVETNVARGIKPMAPNRQKRFLTLEEIGKLGVALREAEKSGHDLVPLAAIRFLLMSGCRRMEVLALPAKWVDRRAGCIRFGDTKTGAQIRPIGADAFAALDGFAGRNGWVFPASKGEGHYIGLPRVLERLTSAAGLEDVTIHVLRHSFASTAAEMGFSELTIAGLLGHSVPGVTARYAHVADTALVDAANRVSGRIAAALAGKKPARVLPLVRKVSGAANARSRQ